MWRQRSIRSSVTADQNGKYDWTYVNISKNVVTQMLTILNNQFTDKQVADGVVFDFLIDTINFDNIFLQMTETVDGGFDIEFWQQNCGNYYTCDNTCHSCHIYNLELALLTLDQIRF